MGLRPPVRGKSLRPGKPDSVEMPIQTNSPPLSQEVYQTGWRKVHWPVDEIFMAWQYARYVGKVVAEGKAEYNIPCSRRVAAAAEYGMAGTYPSGGPLPQVHDLWRAGAPAIDILAPDLYLDISTRSAAASRARQSAVHTGNGSTRPTC